MSRLNLFKFINYSDKYYVLKVVIFLCYQMLSYVYQIFSIVTFDLFLNKTLPFSQNFASRRCQSVMVFHLLSTSCRENRYSFFCVYSSLSVMSLASFYATWNHPKVVVSGVTGRDQWKKMG